MCTVVEVPIMLERRIHAVEQVNHTHAMLTYDSE